MTAALLLAGAAFSNVHAQTIPTDLVGTWSSKANSTLTGDVGVSWRRHQVVNPG